MGIKAKKKRPVHERSDAPTGLGEPEAAKKTPPHEMGCEKCGLVIQALKAQ